MKLPDLKSFLDIQDRVESLGPSKVPEVSREDLGPKEVYFSWERTLSPGEKTVISKRFSRPVIIIGIFVGLLLLIMQEFVLILVIGSIIFFLQALGKMVPENVTYQISNHGLMIDDKIHYWDSLRRFFFIERDGVEIVAIDTVQTFPGRLYVHFDHKDKEKIKELFDKYLHHIESEPRTFLDNTYDRVLKRFNVSEESPFSQGSVKTEEETGEKKELPKKK